ncbi:hypothetical protein, conserved [Trypanosoma brucei brucei TREU927]|uniref:Uncharacterized protein n=1 Tax=Trypanosoma brucei brucei (strain 927/4 GUTat10.1) TaxID=185431 RepID=Q382G8_TRYB2|nr:hypothetical protein, conserved [Trypanosoma brucei brucei TREU927]EAN80313.1 hypothetical protein, conserved [Trypanosoma brucei brucei TREU927]
MSCMFHSSLQLLPSNFQSPRSALVKAAMESIFCVEQVNVPPELGTIMKQYTKAILRDRPADLYKYSANFFAALCGQAAPFDKDGRFIEEEGECRTLDRHAEGGQCDVEVMDTTLPADQEDHDIVRSVLNEYDMNGEGRMPRESIPMLLAGMQKTLQLSDDEVVAAEQVLASLETDENDTIDLLEFRQMFFSSGYEQ